MNQDFQTGERHPSLDECDIYERFDENGNRTDLLKVIFFLRGQNLS